MGFFPTARLRNLWWPEVCFKAILSKESQGPITLSAMFFQMFLVFVLLEPEKKLPWFNLIHPTPSKKPKSTKQHKTQKTLLLEFPPWRHTSPSIWYFYCHPISIFLTHAIVYKSVKNELKDSHCVFREIQSCYMTLGRTEVPIHYCSNLGKSPPGFSWDSASSPDSLR